MAMGKDSSRQRELCLVYPGSAKESSMIERGKELELKIRKVRYTNSVKPFRPLEDDGFYPK